MIDKSFRTALLVSAAIHSLIFLGISPRLLHLKHQENIRISYKRNSPPPFQKRAQDKKDLIENTQRRYDAREFIEAARGDKAELSRPPQLPVLKSAAGYMPKPLSLNDTFPALKKKVTLPHMEMSMNVRIKDNSSYTGYYEIIREKIRHAAYRNYAQTETGEMHIAFVVGNDGSLRDVRYLEEKSTPSQYLKEISIRSIQEAGPFPAFPPDLDYPQLSFNVVISFQFEE